MHIPGLQPEHFLSTRSPVPEFVIHGLREILDSNHLVQVNCPYEQ